MGFADHLLGKIVLQEKASKPVKLLRGINGLTFTKRKKVSIPAGSYLFIEFDELAPSNSIITNLDTGDLFIVDTKLFKKSTK